jgi:hypothetical protein
MTAGRAEYRVVWEIDVCAETPLEAARQARWLQRQTDTTAVVFDVYDPDGDVTRIDLEDDHEVELTGV